MGIIVEGPRSVLLGGQAWIVEEGRELAWAESHIVRNDAFKYVLGKFVEADRPNENGHIFDLAELKDAQTSIAHSPLNMLHRPHFIVGSYIASELIYPVSTEAAAVGGEEPHPYVEALAAFYRYYFPDLYTDIEKAHNEGSLFYSMECVPETVKCAGVCGREFAYDGRVSKTYCDHLNMPRAQKRLGKPHFTGGALIVPPVLPGWKRADITQLSSLLTERSLEAEMVYGQVAEEFPHLDSLVWERMMAQLLTLSYAGIEGGEWAKDFSTDKRKQLAKEGKALPDGSYPIESPEDLANAIKAFGRSNPGDRAKVKAHIVKRAKALGKTDVLPDGWST